jgi:hypothetical protein
MVWPTWGAAKLGWSWYPYATFAVLIVVACILHVGSAFDRVRPYRWYGRVGLTIIHLVLVTVSVWALERGSHRESVLALVVLIGPIFVWLDTARRMREGLSD